MNTISIDEWLDVIEEEYLSTFIKDGGSAVKFAVSTEARTSALLEALKCRCEKSGYMFMALDAVARRFHMPQDIFFGLASRINWRLLARRLILRLLSEKGIRIDSIDPGDTVNVPGDTVNVIDSVARANDHGSEFIIRALNPALEDEVFENINMAKAFRVAMLHLCLKEMEPGQYRGKPLLDWLRGADTRISNVKPFQIYTGINRTTARYFIESALYWIRHVGYAGTVIVLDNARVTMARNPRDGQRFYTRAMTMDHYELLRRFVDDIDRLSGTLLVVATGRDFIDPLSKRGWAIYDALRTRVMDDVRDKNLVNPAAALVRLS